MERVLFSTSFDGGTYEIESNFIKQFFAWLDPAGFFEILPSLIVAVPKLYGLLIMLWLLLFFGTGITLAQALIKRFKECYIKNILLILVIIASEIIIYELAMMPVVAYGIYYCIPEFSSAAKIALVFFFVLYIAIILLCVYAFTLKYNQELKDIHKKEETSLDISTHKGSENEKVNSKVKQYKKKAETKALKLTKVAVDNRTHYN